MVPLCAALLAAWPVRADPPSSGSGELEPAPEQPEDPLLLMMEFELNEQQIVEQAAKTRTTIQEAPAIVTVITAREIRDRGYRTVTDVLQTIPGFEGDRWEFNGWLKDSLTRGLPGTTLVLLDGVNIVEPARNTVVLDRKVPLDIVKRIEVISGPGSVLWGSNALLGVINIITHDGRSKPELEVRTGGGDGPGARGAARLHASFGGTWLDDLVRLYVAGTWYTTMGPELSVDHQKVFGPFPRPATDGYTVFVPGEATAEPFARDHYVNVAGNLGIGPVTIGWNTGWEAEHRELGSGGGILSASYLSEGSETVDAGALVTRGSDQVHSAYARYQDRFLGQDFGVFVQTHFVWWELDEDPFGVFPRSPVLPLGGTTTLRSEGQWRTGVNLDLDYHLPLDHHLLIGAEAFVDASEGLRLTSFDPRFGPNTSPDACRAPFQYAPGRDPNRPCSVEELALNAAQRVIGAVYVTDEWKITDRVGVNLGVRGQFSTTYDPELLLSAGVVVGLHEGVFLKLSYAEGFRPPDFQSTSTTSGIASGVTFEANPDLDVETSQSIEAEVNARLFENVGAIRRWYVRADYSYTRMEGVITFPAGRFENSGDRDIHSVELLTKLQFVGDHELWLSYYFVDVVDSEIGRLRNIANHTLNAGGRVSFFDGHLRLSTVLTLRGSMEDLNRTPSEPAPGPPLLALPGTQWVQATGVEVTNVPTAALLRFGIEGRRIFGAWDISAWVYNALNTGYTDPDYFFDDRIMARPQAKPGVSFFVETGVRW